MTHHYSKRPPAMNGDVSHIEAQARSIRNIAQAVIDACYLGKPIEAYSRNKIAGGSLAGDAAVLGIMLIQYELGEEEEEEG